MSGPSLPRLEGHIRHAQTRPRAEPRAPATSFPALIDGEGEDDLADANATPFDAGGMLGRASEADTAPVSSAPLTVRVGPAPPPQNTSPKPEAQTILDRVDAVTTGSPHIERGGDIARGTAALGGQHRASTAPPMAKSAGPATVPMHASTFQTRDAASAPARAITQPRMRAANTNCVFVALRALDESCIVYARAGRMSSAEREALDHSIRALLAEHGITSEAVRIDAVITRNKPGWDTW